MIPSLEGERESFLLTPLGNRIGEWQALKKPILQKKFKENQQPQYSFFRYGLDHLRNLFFQPNTTSKQLTEFIQFITFPTISGAGM
jgi:hypothetical protein